MVALLAVVLAVIGFFAALIASRRTRGIALALLGVGGIGVIFFLMLVSYASFERRATNARSAPPASITTFPSQRRPTETSRAPAKPRIDLDALTKDLDRFTKADPINDPPLQVVKQAPDWGERPASDYEPDSEFVKEIVAEHKADWLIIKRPRSKRGLDHALAQERWVVREAVRDYAIKRSKGKLADDAELGMDDEEIYKRFVKHRQLVEKRGEHTIYTMIVIRNAEGGDELFEKTLALAKQDVAVASADNQSAPDWVATPPKRVGEVFRQVITSGPYASVEECHRDADIGLVTLASTYAEGRTPSAEPPNDPYTTVSFTAGELQRRLVRDTHVETVDASFGPMKRLYTLIEITPDDGRWLVAQRQEHEQRRRLSFVAMIAGGVLGVVALALVLLKADEVTRGYYTKRLLIGVPAVILACVVLFALVA